MVTTATCWMVVRDTKWYERSSSRFARVYCMSYCISRNKAFWLVKNEYLSIISFNQYLKINDKLLSHIIFAWFLDYDSKHDLGIHKLNLVMKLIKRILTNVYFNHLSFFRNLWDPSVCEWMMITMMMMAWKCVCMCV